MELSLAWETDSSQDTVSKIESIFKVISAKKEKMKPRMGN